MLLGGVLQLAAQIVPLRRARHARWRRSGSPATRRCGRVLRLIAPSAFGAAVYQINVMLEHQLRVGAARRQRVVLWYAGRVFEFPLGLVAVALGTAALPSFADAGGARRARRDAPQPRASPWR